MPNSAEAREWHRIIRASVRECLKKVRPQLTVFTPQDFPKGLKPKCFAKRGRAAWAAQRLS